MKPYPQEDGWYYKITFHHSRYYVRPRAAKMYAAILVLSFSAAVLAVPLPYGAYRSKFVGKSFIYYSGPPLPVLSLQCHLRLIPNKCKPYNKVSFLKSSDFCTERINFCLTFCSVHSPPALLPQLPATNDGQYAR